MPDLPLFWLAHHQQHDDADHGKAVRASILGIARQGIFLIPFVLILPHCIGILGIQLAQPIADIISCLLAIPLQLQLLREMQREERRLTP